MSLPAAGTLYLVPNLLGVVPPEDVLPARTLAIARTLTHWIVETPKPARAFLKSIGHARAIADLAMRTFEDHDVLAWLAAGHDVGVLSDAGCPGIADPGAAVVAMAHRAGVRVVPLVGPSSIVLALMASGMNGQRFAFHGYLPVPAGERAQAIRRLEEDARASGRAQIFIETPYRNAPMLASLAQTLRGDTELVVAADVTLPTETIERRTAAAWKRENPARFAKRPAIYIVDAASRAPSHPRCSS
ncbi:MAG: SAM-dependent methyltransferase [Burkholderiales bacterium]